MTEAAIDGQSSAGDAESETSGTGADLAAYTRVYEEHNARLVAYAVTLTGNRATAEDLVAEAHFRVWRRISAGHAVENIPAYLAVTVRNLANTLHRTANEIPLPAETAEAAGAEFGRPATTVAPDDPSQQVAHVDFVTRLLKDLPERWVRALWLAEVEDLPLEAVGRSIGANSNATAVLLNRAREGLRQAFLRGYPGAPVEEACAKHWQKMPSLVRGGLSARQTDSVRMHAEDCDDCRARLAALQQVNLRLPALLGPALLVFTLGGGGLRLLAAAGGGAAGAKGAGIAGGVRHLRHVGGKLRHGASSGGKVTAVSAGVLGSTAAIAAAAVALTGAGHARPATHSQQPASPKVKAAAPAAKAVVPAAKTTSAKPTTSNPKPSPKPVAVPVPQRVAPAKQTAAVTPKPAAPAKHAAAAAVAKPTPAPVQYTPRHAAPPVVTQPPATPKQTPKPAPTPTPVTVPTTPKQDQDIQVSTQIPSLPKVTVTIHLHPDDQGQDQGRNQNQDQNQNRGASLSPKSPG